MQQALTGPNKSYQFHYSEATAHPLQQLLNDTHAVQSNCRRHSQSNVHEEHQGDLPVGAKEKEIGHPVRKQICPAIVPKCFAYQVVML